MEKKEDGLGSRCGHTLTAVPVVGEEGYPNNIGPRLILFGGATALEGNSAASGTRFAGSAPGIASLKSMETLRLLKIRNAYFNKGPGYLPNELQRLNWHTFPSTSLPEAFEGEKLVGLKLSRD
ncbi:hypothetical protein HAX54_013069 [Datura stramonium]|uniref:Uncharacterized protein n=1 Tax=Datura stramonium TaxID=4076 RepID=A0ABS8RY45_DATST|nr:hypothetical protein [Datura stramonium]